MYQVIAPDLQLRGMVFQCAMVIERGSRQDKEVKIVSKQVTCGKLQNDLLEKHEIAAKFQLS